MLSKRPHSASLYGGYTGVAWTVAHLEGSLLDPDGEDPNDSIDETLDAALQSTPWNGPFDLIEGLVGIGVYALERLPRPSAAECLRQVIDRLDETATHTDDGIAWWSRPEWIGAIGRRAYPNGYYNLGLAHGTPGVIAFLGAAASAGVCREKARRLLDGAVRWLLAHELQDDPAVRFPSYVGPDIQPSRARLAWCYGDLGIAAALASAARCVQEPAWEQESIRTARAAASLPPEQSRVIDAGLCHGAAGVAHFFNRMFQLTGEEDLAAAARYWYARTLDLRRPGEGAAGFLAWVPDAKGELGWHDDRGLLTGAAGIGLALLAAISTEEPAWDRMLLPSLPVPPTEHPHP